MQFVVIRLGKDSRNDISKLDSTMTEDFQPFNLTFRCKQVESSISTGNYVWLYLGSDNNAGTPTAWTQGIRALGIIEGLDLQDFNSESEFEIKVISLFPESLNQYSFLDYSPELYKFFSAYPVIGVRNSRNNSAQKVEEGQRVSTPALLTSVSKLYPAFAEDLQQYAPELLAYINFSPPNTSGSGPTPGTPPTLASYNKILFGAPGTGKSHKVDLLLRGTPEEQKQRVTFHPEYDYSSFVGSYRPMMVKEGSSEEVKYRFSPQAFTNIYVSAWQNLSLSYFLTIEEINRGNCAEIFGDIFQLLDRKNAYRITPSEELRIYLENVLGKGHNGIASGKMILPPNLTLLATMNTSDQSLFPMDSAFKRRWSWEYVPINYSNLNEDGTENKSFSYIVKIDSSSTFKWIQFISKANTQIKTNPNLGMDKCIGNYFIYSETGYIELEEFINKVVFYLWNDVFKDESESPFNAGQTYEDFFPIRTKGVQEIKALLTNLGVDIDTVPPSIATEEPVEQEFSQAAESEPPYNESLPAS